MSKCLLDVKKDIIQDAGERLVKLKATVEGAYGYFTNPKAASAAINEVNAHYQEIVVKEGEKGSFFIDPPTNMIDEYFEDFQAGNNELDEVSFRPEGFYMGDSALEEQEKKDLFFQTIPGVKFTEDLKQKLLSFLKGLNISVEFDANEMLNSKQFKRNPLAAFDVLQKTMAFASGEEKLLPRQVAAAVYTFLGRKSTLSKSLWVYIKQWEDYKKWYDVYSSYTNKYDFEDVDMSDEHEEYMKREDFNPFAHKMAIVKFLEQSFIKVMHGEKASVKMENEDVDVEFFKKRGYLNPMEKDISELKSIFRRIWNWFLKNIVQGSPFKTYDRQSLTDLGLDIAEDVLKQDYSKFLRGFKLVDGQLFTSNGDLLELKDYDETLSKDPVAYEMINKLINNPFINFKLSGSLTLRKYGELFRDIKEDLHDIDGVITLETFNQDPNAQQFVRWIREKGLSLSHAKENRRAAAKRFYKEVRPMIENLNWYKNLMIEFPDFKMTNVFIGRDHKKGESVTIQGQVKRNGREYKFDFFLRTAEGHYPEIFDNYWKDWKQIFEAKLHMGRSKDIFDLIYFNPFLKDKYKFTNKGFRYFVFEDDTIQNQVSELPASKATDETLKRVKEAAKKMGIDIQLLTDYAKAHPEIDTTTVNGVADLVKGIIAIAEGKENVALTEEMVHLATAILEQTNPKMVTEMISKIGNYKIYAKTLELYKNNKDYQLPNGKPDIRKIKKEAADKLIAELIIKKSEGSTEFPELLEEIPRSTIRNIWSSVLNWIKSLYQKANTNIFESVAEMVISGDVGARYYGKVKPGVQELFDTNPELASIGTVEQYSAYLDTKEIKQDDNSYYRGQIEKPTIDKDGNLVLYVREDELYKRAGLPSKGISMTDNLQSAIEYGDGQLEVAKNLASETYDAEAELERLSKNGYWIVQISKGVSNKIVKEAGEVKVISDDKIIIPKDQYKLEQVSEEADIEGFIDFVSSAPAAFTGRGTFYQIGTNEQNRIVSALDKTADSIEKKESKETPDPLLLDTEEASNFYEETLPDGTKQPILKRVTDRVKAWYAERFRGKVFTEQEKTFNELKRRFGIEGHQDFQEIHARYYNSDGTKKIKPDARPKKINLPSQEMYNELENYYKDLIKSFPKDTLILSEKIIYDPAQKEAGTVDFLAIEPSGKTHILDWKFLYISPDRDDVAWFKQKAYDIQLGRYKQILKDVYGVKEFGKTRAIPILMNFKLKNRFAPKKGYTLKGIAVGSVNPNDIEDLRLIPISEKTESTGEEEVDALIKKLNALLSQIENEEVAASEREFKIERLNILRQTIRIIQATGNIAPLIDTIEVMRLEGDRILNDYEITYKNRPASSSDSSNSELSDFAEDMNNYIKLSEIFINIGRDIGHLIYSPEMKKKAITKKQKEELEDRRDAYEKLISESNSIYKSAKDIKKASFNFADKHIGERNLITGLSKPEAVIKGLGSLFRGVSDLPQAALQILYKLTRAAIGKASHDSLEEVKELMALRERVMKKTQDPRAYLKKLYQKDDKGGFVNKLIYKYSKKFRETVDDKFNAGGDRKWLLDNIDVDAYMEEAQQVIKNRVDQIKRQVYSGTKEQVAAKKKKAIVDVYRQYDITRRDFTGGNNYIIKKHPLPIWYSDEFKEVEKDEDLLALYNFIDKFNKKAEDVGYISNSMMRTFLPFVTKTMAEELAWGSVTSAVGGFGDGLSIKASDAGYGKINEITGQLESSIPKYYTHDFTQKEGGVNDFSEVSEDLFKNLILYVQHVNKYKYLREVEGQLNLVKTIEEFKEHHLNTDKEGKVILDSDGQPEKLKGNKENAKMYDDFLRTLLYDQKYVLTNTDTALYPQKVLNFFKGVVNKVAGKEIWKPNENPSPISLLKTMDAANRGFQIKTLGLEVIPGLVNLFGGNAQMAAQAGHYFNYGEFMKSQREIVSQEFSSNEEKKKFIELINLFMPLKDDPSHELYKKAGLSKLTNANFGDMLMITMSYPEQLIEKATFKTLLKTLMVHNGKVVSIKDFVKKKYADRYKSATGYREAKKKIEEEIKELSKTSSIAVVSKVENGQLIIPGLDTSNVDEIQKVTNLTRRISRNALGGVSDGDINRMSMDIWRKSMMVFKGWIPKLFDTRFSELRKVSDDFSVEINEHIDPSTGERRVEVSGERYEIGRLRLLGYVMMNSFRNKAADIISIINMTDKGIESINDMYDDFAKKYKERTGETFNMTREDFADMIKTNLQNQLRELAILASLVGASLSMGFMAPDDDDDRATKNFYRWSQRVIDKFQNELSFFYNPLEFEKILSGSMFPAIGLITDMTKFLQHFWLQITGLDFDPESSFDDVRKKAQPIKYAAKALPFFKSVMTYGAIISDDFAKEFDITIQKERAIK